MREVSPAKKQKVPLLELSDVNSSIPTLSSSPCTIQTQVRVLFNNAHQLQSDEDMIRVHDVYEAKRALANRTDIVQYITDEDLLRIQQMNGPVRLRLCIDTEEPVKTARRLSVDVRSHSGHNSPSSRRASAQRDHAQRDHSQRDHSQRDPAHSRLKHNKSVDTDRREASIALRSGQFRVLYTTSAKTYLYFVIEEHDGSRLICRGLDEIQIRGDILITYEYSTVINANAGFLATIYSPNLRNTSLPIYLHVVQPATVGRMVEMVSDVIELAQSQYDINDVSHKVDELCQLMKK